MKGNKTPPQPKPDFNSKNFDMFFEFDQRLTKDFIRYEVAKEPKDGYVFLALALDEKNPKKCAAIVNIQAEWKDITRLLIKGAKEDDELKNAVIEAGKHLSQDTSMNIAEILHKIITRNNGEENANLLAEGRGLAANIDTGEVQEIPIPQELVRAFERARGRGFNRRRPGVRRIETREQIRRGAVISITYKKCD